MPTCQALIQQGVHKGQSCTNETDEIYCSKHKRQAILDKAIKENLRYCDIARGCYTVLEDHQSKCMRCLHQARIRDRKREDQKRQDPNLCLDCGTTLTEAMRAKGKHEKLLRRCVPCYKKMVLIESQRTPRERLYKAEAFANKHVLWNHYVKSAQKRRIDFAISKTVFQDLIIKPCFYCGYVKEGEVNGLDRLDNNKGYLQENLMPSCTTCNLLKGTQHPQEFIDKMTAIHTYSTDKTPIRSDIVEIWQTTYRSKCNPVYKAYAKSANSRNIEFLLSEEEFIAVIKQPCYLCGLTTSESNKNGVDRFNNDIGYRLDNSRPCCGHCNLLKKDIEYDVLIEKGAKISSVYGTLTGQIATKVIPVRNSKTEARIKIEDPLTESKIARDYKPLNEVILPKGGVPESIQELLKETPIVPKQWKTKQIYEAIQDGKDGLYKVYCEGHNSIEPGWKEQWDSFVRGVKGATFEISEPIIKAFIEHLRRIRHNQLCAKTRSGQ
jgi:hypothetical protein